MDQRTCAPQDLVEVCVCASVRVMLSQQYVLA
jgi:hypothetical protein